MITEHMFTYASRVITHENTVRDKASPRTDRHSARRTEYSVPCPPFCRLPCTSPPLPSCRSAFSVHRSAFCSLCFPASARKHRDTNFFPRNIRFPPRPTSNASWPPNLLPSLQNSLSPRLCARLFIQPRNLHVRTHPAAFRSPLHRLLKRAKVTRLMRARYGKMPHFCRTAQRTERAKITGATHSFTLVQQTTTVANIGLQR